MSRILIKLGGAALEASTTLDAVTRAIREYQEFGYRVILVHGGGPSINAELQRLGVSWQFVGGQRVTSPQMMGVIEKTLGETVNGRVVDYFRAHGLAALGCSGAQHSTLLCRQAAPDLGQVGQIEKVNSYYLDMVLASAQIPVIAPLGVGAAGQRYNINADWAAAHLAVALGAEQLLFLTDQVGILDEEGVAIDSLDAQGLENMMDAQTVSGGMLTKARAVLHALRHRVPVVRVLSAHDAGFEIPHGRRGTSCFLKFKNDKSEGSSHVAI